MNRLVPHLSQETIKAFLDKQLPPDQLLQVSDHLAECDECANDAAAALHLDRLSSDLVSEFGNAHLEFEDFDTYLSGPLSDPRRQLFARHMDQCELCRSSLQDLKDLQSEMTLNNATVSPAESSGGFAGFFAAFRPSYIVAFAFALLILGLGVWFLLSRSVRDEKAVGNPPRNEQIPSAPPGNRSIEFPTNTEVQKEIAAVASITDGGKRIELLADGSLRGGIPAAFQERVRNALTNGQLEIPNSVSDLKGSGGTLMGNGSGAPFAIVFPVGKVLETARPKFKWKPSPGAESYVVEVFDRNYNAVAASGDIRGTSWQPEKPLARGQKYSWQVTAKAKGLETKSPVRPAPEAKFLIIGQDHFEEIQRVKNSAARSHMMFGIAYANAGMLAEAEIEFRSLLRANPNSDVARRLIAKVSASR